MATQRFRIVSGEESEIHDEPHIEGTRVFVRVIQARVEESGRSPQDVADGLGIDVADVYHALAYYHDNPEEMREVECQHAEAVERARERSSITPSDDEE